MLVAVAPTAGGGSFTYSYMRNGVARTSPEKAAKVILAAVPYQDRAGDVDFVPDPDIVVPGAHELALMEAERIRSGKFTG